MTDTWPCCGHCLTRPKGALPGEKICAFGPDTHLQPCMTCQVSDEPECPCVAAGQPVYEAVGVHHLMDCPWFAWFYRTGGCQGDV